MKKVIFLVFLIFQVFGMAKTTGVLKIDMKEPEKSQEIIREEQKNELLKFGVKEKSISIYFDALKVSEEGKAEEFKKLLLKSIEEDNRNYYALEKMARYYLIVEKDIYKATEYFEKVIDVNPKNEEIYDILGKLYFMSDKQKAIKVFEKLLIINPNSFEAYSGLAIAYYEEKDLLNSYENIIKALEIFTKTEKGKIEPTSILIMLRLLVETSYVIGDYETSVKTFLEIYPYIKDNELFFPETIKEVAKKSNEKLKIEDKKLWEKYSKKFIELGI